MWVVAAILVCAVDGGCSYGTRDENAPERWTTGATKAQCEARILDDIVLVAKENDVPLSWMKAICERLGA